MRRASALLSLVLIAASPSPAPAQPWRGLQALPRLAIEVLHAPDHPGPPPDELERRIEESIRQAAPALAIDPVSIDRVRLVVTVRPVGATELRGFWLPFSGIYGVGSIRLAVERRATVSGIRAPVPVLVWQAERQIRGPWYGSPRAILTALDELLEELVEDYRRAAGS